MRHDAFPLFSSLSTVTAALSLTVDAGQAGQRLDKVLSAAFSDLSRSRLKSLIEAGHVRCGDVPVCDAAVIVREGQTYVLTPPAAVDAVPQAEMIAFPVLFEDDDLLVLDKPAGLVTHPAPGNETGTLVNALLGHCGDTLPGIGGEKRPGIVHRLDKDTSGVMVVAKTETVLAALSAMFAARDLDRRYLALCWGVPVTMEGQIDAPIGRDPKDRKRMAVAKNGKPALTHYKVLQTWHHAVSLLECRLATGRTHQIRVHMGSIGHPLVGDPVYLRRIPVAARALPPDLRALLLDFPRQALHAKRLAFRHPRTGALLEFETSPPDDMAALLAAVAGP